MNKEELKAFKKEWTMVCAYYGREVRDDVLNMVASDLEQYSFKDVITALMIYRRDSKNKFAPLPAMIIDLVEQQNGIESEYSADAIAMKIWAAIGSIGSYANRERLKQKFNAVELAVVDALGPWSQTCANTQAEDKGTFIAQTRNLARTMIERNKFGRLSKQSGELVSLGSIVTGSLTKIENNENDKT